MVRTFSLLLPGILLENRVHQEIIDRRMGVVPKPLIEMLRVNNVRKGFLELEQFRAVLRHLPDECKAVATVAYVTGWRRKELLTRQWRDLDLDAGWLRLESDETKNREGPDVSVNRDLT